MTEATLRALDGLRDLSTLKWYVIPLLAIVFYSGSRGAKEASLAEPPAETAETVETTL